MRIAVIVAAVAVCTAAFVPVRAQTALPLADVKLVAEKSVPYSELAAAQKNGNRNGNGGNQTIFGHRFGYVSIAATRHSDGELVAVELR